MTNFRLLCGFGLVCLGVGYLAGAHDQAAEDDTLLDAYRRALGRDRAQLLKAEAETELAVQEAEAIIHEGWWSK